MNIELHYVGKDGTDRILPDVTDANISPVFGDYGSLNFSYPVTGKNFDLLRDKDEFELRVWIDGVLRPKLGGLIKDIDGDDVEETSIWKFTGLMYLCILDEALTFPAGWPNYLKTAPSRTWTAATAGNIMKTYLAEAQARGAIAGVTFNSFTATTDSNGQPWTKQINIEVKPGVKLGALAKNLLALGLAEFEMVGRDFRMYNPGTLTVDRTIQANPLTFRKGRDISDSPRKRSSREVTTAVLAAGKEDSGLYHLEVDESQVAARRRIEGYVSNGSIADAGTLEAYSELHLTQTVQAKMEKTHGLEFADPKSPRPLDHFDVGDWVYSDVGRGLEKLRIKQWVLSKAADGRVGGSVILNDLFAEASERLAQRMEGISGGATITGESRATDIPAAVVDGLAPKTPAGLSLTSAAYSDNQGNTSAAVAASWSQVTQNEDNTILEDLGGHEIEWTTPNTPGAAGSRYVPVGVSSFVQWSPVMPDVLVRARIRAFDKIGNTSPWSEWVEHVTASDTTPPGVLATPAIQDFMGLFEITWNGKLETGGAVPGDFRHAEVHISKVNDFTPDATTAIGVLTQKGPMFYRGVYGDTYYTKLVPVDRSGNVGTPSAQASGVTEPIVGADILDGAVGSLKLADLAVTNAKLGDLAVNTAKVSELSVARLSAGIMTAAITVAGRFATALTGARTEFNSLGFFRYDDSGNALVAIDANGALITGKYRTAISGRRIEMGTTSDTMGRINFWSPDGDNGFLRAYTQASGTEAIQLGMNRAGITFPSLWNMLNINANAAEGEFITMRSGTLELWFDAGNVQKPLGVAGNGRFVVFSTIDRNQDGEKARFEINKNMTRMWDETGMQRFGIAGTDTRFWDHIGQQQMAMTRDWVGLNGQVQILNTPTPRLDLRRADGYLIHGSNVAGAYQEYNPDGSTKFFVGTSKGVIAIDSTGGAATSPHVRWMTSEGYGALIKSWRDARGVAVEFRQWDDSNFLTVRASNFEVNSDLGDKENIEPAGIGSYLDKMGAKPIKFKRKGDFLADPEMQPRKKKGKRAAAPAAQPQLVELGLGAQELPEDVRLGSDEEGWTYGQAQMNAFLWGAVQELAGKVGALEKGENK